MSIIRLNKNAAPDEVISAVGENGYVIIDELATPEQIARVQAELDPFIEATQHGQIDVPSEKLTRRTGAVVARSPTARSLLMNELALAVCEARLAGYGYHLSLTEVISLSPSAPSQVIHRDEIAFGGYPFCERLRGPDQHLVGAI